MLAVAKYHPNNRIVVRRQRKLGIKWARRVRCTLCGELRTRETAHRHQNKWICDEQCWEERLRSSE